MWIILNKPATSTFDILRHKNDCPLSPSKRINSVLLEEAYQSKRSG